MSAVAHFAKKRFGQHFLHDPAVVERILRCLAPQPQDNLVEIDRDVVAPLRAACGESPGLQIHLADALDFDFGSLAAAGPLRLVGNLPYNISTPLLFHLLKFAGAVRDMHFMLQKEVVDRIVASPGSGDYGRLTATLFARAEADALFEVGSGAFRPPPKVQSAVVRIRPRPAPFPIADLAIYDRVVTTAFSQRRKTLGNALKTLLPAAAIAAAGVDPGARAETLAPADFARLALQLKG